MRNFPIQTVPGCSTVLRDAIALRGSWSSSGRKSQMRDCWRHSLDSGTKLAIGQLRIWLTKLTTKFYWFLEILLIPGSLKATSTQDCTKACYLLIINHFWVFPCDLIGFPMITFRIVSDFYLPTKKVQTLSPSNIQQHLKNDFWSCLIVNAFIRK